MSLLFRRLCTVLFVELSWLATASKLHFFNTDETLENLPPSIKDLPEQLQGVFWMDQGGVYGHSDKLVSLASAPDLAFTMNEANSDFDRETRTLTVDVTAPGWQWMNNWKGLLFAKVLGFLKFKYRIEWNEKYTFGQIVPTFVVPLLDIRMAMPTWLLSFTFELADPHTPCPPPEGTSKKDMVKCATWRRPSTGLLMKPLGSHGVFNYYMWRIADKHGKPIQPYYDAFMKYAKTTDAPPTTLASLFGIDLGKGNEAGTSFFVAPSSAAGGKFSEGKGSEL